MVVILILRNLLEEKKVSKVFKVYRGLKEILENGVHKVNKEFKVYKAHKARLDHKVNRGPHLLIMISLKLNLKI